MFAEQPMQYKKFHAAASHFPESEDARQLVAPIESEHYESKFDKLVHSLAHKKHPPKDAKATAAAIGMRKFGVKGMEKKAQAGKKKAEHHSAEPAQPSQNAPPGAEPEAKLPKQVPAGVPEKTDQPRVDDLEGLLHYARYTKHEKDKISRVMKEFRDGTLKSSSGHPVKNRDQAIAIALSEAGVSKNQ